MKGANDMENNKTLTRAGLAEVVVDRVGLARHDAVDLVEDVLREISVGLVEKDCVKLSSFGTFVVRQKSERVGRNPKTGKEAVIKSRKVLVFKASNLMKEYVNQQCQGIKAAE